MAYNEDRNTVLFGITGGIGSGKSSVAKIIQEAGNTVLFADDVAKELMQAKPELREKLVKEFGQEIYSEEKLNTEALAKKVFGSGAAQRQALRKLESIVHPHTLDELRDRIEKLSEQGEKVLFVEIPLLFEIGLEDAFDYVITVDAPKDIRIQRAMERSKISREEIEHRISEQMSDEEKKGKADFVVDNSGSLDKLKTAVNFLLTLFPQLPPKDDTELMEHDAEKHFRSRKNRPGQKKNPLPPTNGTH